MVVVTNVYLSLLDYVICLHVALHLQEREFNDLNQTSIYPSTFGLACMHVHTCIPQHADINH